LDRGKGKEGKRMGGRGEKKDWDGKWKEIDGPF